MTLRGCFRSKTFGPWFRVGFAHFVSPPVDPGKKRKWFGVAPGFRAATFNGGWAGFSAQGERSPSDAAETGPNKRPVTPPYAPTTPKGTYSAII